MKKILLLTILFLINPLFGQKSNIDKLMIEGNQAYQNSDYKTAKRHYESVIKIDSTYKDALFNLAGTELSLGNNSRARELLQKSYSLGDFGAYELIMKYCDGLKYSEKMFLLHVDELPKFKYKNDFEPIVINKKQINPNYTKLLESEIKNSKTLKRIKGKIYIMLNVNIEGQLVTNIKGKISEKQKTKLDKVLKDMTEYKAAKFQGKNVGLFGGGLALPLSF